MARPRSASSASPPWGVPLALVAALLACRAREGERCVCAEDCGEGLSCVASGRVLAPGECSPVVGEDANPGVCLPEDEANEDDGGGGPPEAFMDLGSKLDFEPGPPPDPETGTTDATGTTAGSTDATGTTDATDATGSSGSSSSTTDATGSSGSSGGGTGSTGTGSTGGTTDATGSSGSTSVGT